jgi:RHS repeat-associated protein
MATARTSTRPRAATEGAAVGARVTVASSAAARAVGVQGTLVSVQRDDGNTTASPTQVTVNYAGFQDAFGGDWASRLHLAELPACALTTPDQPNCAHHTVSADLTLSGAIKEIGPTVGDAMAEPVVAAPTTVVALTSSASGGGGDYTATSLRPSGSWQVGGSADSFSWSYPIDVPSVPGDLVPNVALSYDSQAVDGLTSSTNNQPSWIGDGWDYSPGFVERSYQSCRDNPTGPTKTNDNCWSANNMLTLSLNGQTTTLVKDDTTGAYHPQDDSNERVQYKTGAPNGAQNGEYWVVTTTDGTQYYFGKNELPGWVTGNAATNSVWTEPVYATVAGQPCFNATFADSSCQQAYRWNLDYVVDTHSDVVSYFYTKETDAYAADSPVGTTTSTMANTTYDRGGFLTKIQYGQRDNEVYTTQPAAQVIFNTTGRCDQATCDPATLTKTTASHWPDVPFDLHCTLNDVCPSQSPSFWTEYTLSSIQTQSLAGGVETNVDSWSMAHTFPATDDTDTPVSWLSSITRTGQDSKGTGISTTPISLPPVTFTGVPLPNRIISQTSAPEVDRYRMSQIITETGETITVSYTPPDCSATSLPEPSTNQTTCFPDFWTPVGDAGAPIQDWFTKYIVSGVTEAEPFGGSSSDDPNEFSANDTIETHYTPVGKPAWHYNDNPVTPTAQRTWDQWRGYSGMIVTSGTAPNPISKTQYVYFRGMDGDTLISGTRSASVTDLRGDPDVTDANQFTGATYETVIYNGTDVVSDTVSDPWSSSATASQAISGLPPLRSFLTDTADTKLYTPLANGSTRETETDYTHDADGRVTAASDLGDVTTSSDDLCTTTSYADNTATWILDSVDETRTVSIKCATTPSIPADVVSDTRTFYDGATTFGTAPTAGSVTMTQSAVSYTGSVPNYDTTSSTVDEYGRTLTSTNGDGDVTKTTYTPATGAAPTQISVAQPTIPASPSSPAITPTTVTLYDPIRNLPTKVTDPGGFFTLEQYDPLGRITAVYQPGDALSSGTPNLKFTYSVSNLGPSIVNSFRLTQIAPTVYQQVETFYDAMLRQRETQTETPDNERTITDTVYDTDSQIAYTTAPYVNGSAVSTTLVQAQVGQVPSITGHSYDAAGRTTADIAYHDGTQDWQTTYTYGGNFTTTVPPAGQPATTTITDARGNTTDLYQYHVGVPADPLDDPPSDYADTHYAYYPSGKQATVADAAGNSWSYNYDLLGQQTAAHDPDTGTTASTYDGAGQVVTTTDGRGKQATLVYDNDGRKTAQYDTTSTQALSSSNEIAAWTYDKAKIGYPASSTSFSDGDTFTHTITNYTSEATVARTVDTLTGTDAALVPSTGYVTTYGYDSTGHETGETDAAAGNLPSEGISYGYDQFNELLSVTSPSAHYVAATGYTELGQPSRYTLSNGGGDVWIDMSYDDQTQALTDVQTTTSTSVSVVDNLAYHYGNSTVSPGAGLVTSTVDKQNGSATVDTQCFTYDYATRLSGAWTATDNCAATPTSQNSSTVGGPNPYWQSWTYDAAGDRTTEVDHDTTGAPTRDTSTNYTYPAASSATDQPHTLTSTTATGPGATANTASYTYDAAGNTTAITGGATGDEALTWTDQDQLATDSTINGTTNYVYDADGNLLVRRDPGQTTLFLGDEQIVRNTTTGVVTGTRYYSANGQIIASRAGAANPVYLVPDRQGTDQLAVTSDTLAVTRRQYLPFGQTRGTAPTVWPGGDTGYVGGTVDTTTDLENLGAREYDPVTGRFVSPDPVFEASDPTQMGGYDYAGNDPVTGSDPSGLMIFPTAGGPANPNKADPADTDEAHNPVDHPSPRPRPAPPVTHRKPSVADDIGHAAKQLFDPGSSLNRKIWDVNETVGRALWFMTPSVVMSELPDADSMTQALGLGCSHSFAGGTPVLMADGSSKPIDQVKVGDKVADALPGVPLGTKNQVHTVTAVHVTYTDRDYTAVTVKTPHGPATITGTANHPYWDATTRRWTLANKLHIGDSLQTSDGALVTVVALRDYSTSMVTYDLTIDTLHDYYIEAASTPVLVHNCDTEGNTGSGLPELKFTTSSLQHTYSNHAADFGFTGNWNKAAGDLFKKALAAHVGAPDTSRIAGTFRGNPAIHNVDPATGIDVIQDPAGELVSGWRLNPQQLWNVLTRGSL